jgi:glucose-6-phosphate 1-dehydrogenase
MTHEELRTKLRPFLAKTGCGASTISKFLSLCFYKQGNSYGEEKAYQELNQEISAQESKVVQAVTERNRLFYFAIPPNVFEETGIAIKKSCMAENGWTRVIVEKPFGRDLESCEEILATLSKQFQEDQLFRIDHYLGKEMVQNLLVFRFGNMMFERIWDCNSIQCVFLTFKEPFGTDGRGGYFGKQGMIMMMMMMIMHSSTLLKAMMCLLDSFNYLLIDIFKMRIQLINPSYARR